MNLNEINFKILENKFCKSNKLTTKVKTIYHISDIHIHLYKRHSEYKEQFEKVYNYLKNEKQKKNIKENENVNIECILVITGDLLHSKSDLSPECIDMTYTFIKTLSEIMPVIIIPGNHDLNMNNKNRLDSISPILADLPKTHPIYYLQESGVYIYSNLILTHASIFDYHIIPIDILNKLIEYKIKSGILNLDDKIIKKMKKVVLYHGRVNGCELFNGTRLDGEISNKKKTITPHDFKGYDMGLCGDIHLKQNVNKDGNIAYAGSLIQQNLGESIDNHGILKWSVKNNSYKFKEIKNNYGYVTFYLKNGELENKKILEKLSKNLRIRILYNNTSQIQIENFINSLKENHTILEYNIQNSASTMMNSCSNYTENNENRNEIQELNIQDVEYQNNLLKQIILDNYEGIEDSDMKQIINLNNEINKLVKKELDVKNDNSNDNLLGNRYKLSKLEFNNLYSYGENNIINFKELNGVVGIVAPNHMGKSAIIDILLFALFDKFPRTGNIKDIINIRKNNYYLKLVVECGHFEYIIEKSANKTKTSVSKTQCNFYKRNIISGEMTNLSKDTITKTKTYISKYFGNYDDIINTNFSIQNNPTGFIDLDNAKRRKELERIMKFDYIKLISDKAKNSITECKTIIKHLQNTMPPEKINELKENINTFQNKLEKYKILLEDKEVILSDYQDKINKLNQSLNLNVEKEIEKCLESLDIDNILDVNNQVVDEKLNIIKTELQDLNTTLHNELKSFIKICKKGVIQRLDVPNKNDILDFCDEVNLDNILKYKKLIKSYIKEYKKWEKDQNIEKQVKLNSLNNQIRLIEKKLSQYTHKIVTNFINEENITHNEIINEFDNIKNDIRKNIDLKAKELEKYEKIEKDIISWNKKIIKSQKQITKFKDDITKLRASQMPKDLLDKIKEYNNCNINKQNTNESITLLFNKCLDILSKDDTLINKEEKDKLLLMIKEIQSFYRLDQENSFITWSSRYITEDEKIESEILDLDKKIKKDNSKIEKYEKKINDANIILNEKKDIVNNINYLNNEIIIIDKDLETYNSNLDIMNKIKNLENEKKTLENELSENNNEIIEYIDNLENVWSNLKDGILRKKDLELEISSLEKVSLGLDKLIEQMEQNTKIQEDIIKITEKRNIIMNEFNKLNAECQTIRDKCSLNKGQLEKMVEDCNIKVEKEEMLELLTIYKKSLDIIPYILINEIKPILSRKVNDLLSIVTNFNLEFNFDDNKIDIYLTRPIYNNKKILVNNSSGFERFISSLALRLALMEISKLPSPNVMIIDEGWSCFDNENLHNLDVILDHLGQRFDFILTISHLQIIRQHCDKQINLIKDNDGFSIVRFG
jgi:hypothetical protein